MKNNLSQTVKALSYITQVGLTAIIPIFIWIFIAEFIRQKLSLGSYVLIIGIICGVASAYVSLFKLFKAINAENSKSKEEDK